MPARVVYVAPHAFLPPNRRERIRALSIWRALTALADVHPIILGDVPEANWRWQLRSAGASLLPQRKCAPGRALEALSSGHRSAEPALSEVLGVGQLPKDIYAELAHPAALVRHCLNDRRKERLLKQVRAHRAEVVVLGDASVGLLAPDVKKMGVRVILASQTVTSESYAAMAASSRGDIKQWSAAAARALAAAERTFAPCLDQLWVRSAEDLAAYSRLVSPQKIRVIPDAYDAVTPAPLPAANTLLFAGAGNPWLDEDTACRLIAISSKLEARGFAHRLRIAGQTTLNVRAAAQRAPSVEIPGEVRSIAAAMSQASLVVVPSNLAGGASPEILLAMAAGRPVLSTPSASGYLQAEDGVDIVLEADLDAFPDRIVELLNDRDKAQRIAMAGWQFACSRHSQEGMQETVKSCLADLGVSPAPSAAKSFARNISCHIREERAVFNLASRLFVWSFQIRLPATLDALSAELTFQRGRTLPNAFSEIGMGSDGYFVIKCAAILPANIEPESASVRVFAWGHKVFARSAPEAIPHEQGGLLSIEHDGDRLIVEGWSTNGPLEVRVTSRSETLQSVRPKPRNGIFKCSLPAVPGGEISVEPGKGAPQSRVSSFVLQERHPSSARLLGLADRHRGETAWFIGNGPSVKIDDLNALEGKLVFAFNRFHLSYGSTRLRPTYTVTGDQQVIEDFGQQIVDQAGGHVFVAHHSPPDLMGDYAWVRLLPVFPPLFSRSADQFVTPGGSSVFIGMQIAYFMGIRSFYLYGMDFKFAFARSASPSDSLRNATGEGNHFIENYRAGRAWTPPDLKEVGASFLVARTLISHEGGFIRNTTRGGLLEIFDRVPFAAALSGAQRTPSRSRDG